MRSTVDNQAFKALSLHHKVAYKAKQCNRDKIGILEAIRIPDYKKEEIMKEYRLENQSSTDHSAERLYIKT